MADDLKRRANAGAVDDGAAVLQRGAEHTRPGAGAAADARALGRPGLPAHAPSGLPGTTFRDSIPNGYDF